MMTRRGKLALFVWLVVSAVGGVLLSERVDDLSLARHNQQQRDIDRNEARINRLEAATLRTK
jgi:heme exporter protein D